MFRQVVTVTYTLEKKFFTVVTFEGFFSDKVTKLVILVVYLVCMSLLWISREDGKNK